MQPKYPSMKCLCLSHLFSVARSMVTVNKTRAKTLDISWTSGGSLVMEYQVKWERDTSGECPNVDEDSATITGGSTSYTIPGLEEDSSYTITVTATNAAGSAVSVPVSGVTAEASKDT